MNTATQQVSEIQVSASSSNDEIRKVLETNEAFQSNKVVVAAVEKTANPDVLRILLVQTRIDLPAISSTTNPLLALAMNWKNDLGVTVRHFQNVDTTSFNEAKIEIGDTAEAMFTKLAVVTKTEIEIENISIAIQDSLTPDSWEINGNVEIQKPLTTSKGKTLTHKGQFIYRTTELSLNGTTEDILLQVDKSVALRNQ